MAINGYPVGSVIEVRFEAFAATLTLLSESRLTFQIKDGPFAQAETVDTHVIPLGNGLFAVSWKEQSGATVTQVQDYDRGVIHSHATLPDGQFLRMSGPITIIEQDGTSADDLPARNKAIVLEAMTSLFQRRDASAVERLYAADYIQHNPTIPQGRDALKALVEGLSADVFYEPGLILAEGAFVAIHGRIRGWGPKPMVVVDLFRVEGGRLAEHWDVLQEEAPVADGTTVVAMFDAAEGHHAPRR